MKKLLTILVTITAMTSLSLCLAQDEVGLGTVIYDEPGAISNETTSSSLMLNNISFELVKIHLTLANITNTTDPEDEMLLTIKTEEELVKTDIIEALRLSTDRKKTLSEYTEKCRTALAEGDMALTLLQQELSLLKLDMNACQIDKTAADQLYFEGVNTYDEETSSQALDASVANDRCASENRIQYNAKMYLLNKLGFYQSVLQTKYDLIFNEQDTLIDHFDVIGDAMLVKLNTINETLKLYQME